MESNRAIQQGYMTVGEVAKKMNTTVRTLQYYDRENLLIPSAESAGGRRLYSNKDIVRLHQIQSMKYLGFSLSDIKNRLSVLDSPEEVASALSDQADSIRARIAALDESLQAVEALKLEVLQMQSVDLKKYADIIVNLQMGNEHYGLIKHFDDDMLDHLRDRFDRKSGQGLLDTLNRLWREAVELQKLGIPPESEEGLALAEAWWNMVTEFTGGDMSLLPQIANFTEHMDSADEVHELDIVAINSYIEPALAGYFAKLGYNPFEGVEL